MIQDGHIQLIVKQGEIEMNKKLDKNLFEMSYNWTIKTVEKSSGKTLQEEQIHNAVVNVGLNLIRDFIGNVSVNPPIYMAVGTGTTAVDNANTALETEVTRALATIDVATDYEVEFTKTFEFAGSYAITEAGMFDSATASGSTMFNRTTFAAKNVTTEIDLIATCTITIARAA